MPSGDRTGLEAAAALAAGKENIADDARAIAADAVRLRPLLAKAQRLVQAAKLTPSASSGLHVHYVSDARISRSTPDSSQKLFRDAQWACLQVCHSSCVGFTNSCASTAQWWPPIKSCRSGGYLVGTGLCMRPLISVHCVPQIRSWQHTRRRRHLRHHRPQAVDFETNAAAVATFCTLTCACSNLTESRPQKHHITFKKQH
jgi:hypothetical protein